ncbi:MAG: ribosome biogenesis GTPase Der [Bacteroidetes bacterium]|nr:ribosome biogenesis GTPase Der [Bacteroidota bacterium]
MSKIVAIVGRPNVGKSTLFNRLVGQREAIVDPTSGVTRDRHYGMSDWNGHQFSVIDTGGYVDDSGDIFESEIKKQVTLAIDEADIILFVVDAREGVTIMDEDVANILRRSGKKAILVPNKIDSGKQVNMVHEFYSLGMEQIFGISAMSGSGTGELLDAVTELFQPLGESSPENNEELPDLPKISIVGRPNAGKSSLVNMLLGNDRTIVTPLPGTTRDSIHSIYKSFGLNFLLVDTAGIRKKGKVKEDIEFYSVMRAIRSIEHSDVCMLMVDAERGFEAQDLNIFHIIDRNHKGVVIVVNKWDLVDKLTNTHKDFEELIREQTAPFRDVPIVFTSVTEKQRILKAMETAVTVYKNRMRKIPTHLLNDFILPVIEQTPPPAVKGKYVRIKFATQLPTAFPSFVFFCNHPQYLKDPYRRFIENKIREKFDFTGAPMEIFFRQK